jgi:hypothetical protein
MPQPLAVWRAYLFSPGLYGMYGRAEGVPFKKVAYPPKATDAREFLDKDSRRGKTTSPDSSLALRRTAHSERTGRA